MTVQLIVFLPLIGALIAGLFGTKVFKGLGRDADVEWRIGPVRISRRGTAATDGSLGDQIWIRLGDGRRVRGTVTGTARLAADSAADLR